MKVSVALITYNHEKFIAEALESVLMQKTDFQYEIVIGDDCSSDRTREIIGDFQRNHPDKIRLLTSETNMGVKRNLAQTIMACKGDYIALLDGDDYWTAPQKLRHQVGFLDNHIGCSFCFHSVKRIYEDRRSNIFYPPGKKETYTLKDLLRHPSFVHTSSIVFRRESLGEFPSWFFHCEVIIEDWALTVLIARRGCIGYIDEVMAVYRKHSGGVWSGRGPVQQLLWDLETRNVVNAHLKFQNESWMKVPPSRECLVTANQCAQRGDEKLARRYLIKSIFVSALYRRFSPRYFFTSLIQLYFPRLVPHLVACTTAVYGSSLFEFKRVFRKAFKRGANQDY